MAKARSNKVADVYLWWLNQYRGECADLGIPGDDELGAWLFNRARSPRQAARLSVELQGLAGDALSQAYRGLTRPAVVLCPSPLAQARALNGAYDIRDHDAA